MKLGKRGDRTVVIFGKMVRDRVPEIMRGDGWDVQATVLEPNSAHESLKNKLVEECAEYLASNDTEELVDILEVVKCLASDVGCSFGVLLDLAEQKRRHKGSFSDVWLEEASQ